MKLPKKVYFKIQVADGSIGRSVSGQNDCLAVNVHTTNKLKKEPLLPGIDTHFEPKINFFIYLVPTLFMSWSDKTWDEDC